MNDLRLLFWETTAGCNLECIHCRRLDVSKELMQDDLTTQEAFGFIDSLSECAKPILVLSGGEPLFRPDIFDITRYAVKRGLMVSLATNGTLIDNVIAKEIVESGIKRVAISIDGADEKTHDDFRKQPGSLKKAIDGFKRLKNLGMSMQINCTVTRHNRHQCEELYNMALSLGADAIHIFMLVPVGCGVQIAEKNMLPANEYEEILNWMYDKTLEGKIHLKATCAPHYFRIALQRKKAIGNVKDITISGHPHNSTDPAKAKMQTMTKGCLAGTSLWFGSHKGKVFPCAYLPVTAGNVKRKPFREIWETSSVFTALRDTEQLKGKCGICEYKNVCMGCRARAFYDTGNYMDEEPYCIYEPIRMKQKPATCNSKN